MLESLFKKVAKSDSTSATSNEQIFQQVTSDFLQQATSATSNEQILQRVTNNEWVSMSNKQRVKSYASMEINYIHKVI